MLFPLHLPVHVHAVLLILILRLFVGAPSYAPPLAFRPARRCSTAATRGGIPAERAAGLRHQGRDGRGQANEGEKPMTSTLIPPSDLKDVPTTELQSKFFQVAVDIARLRRAAEELPLAEASLRNISDEIAQRKYRYTPKP
jgi:hypothetical protein